MPAFVRGEKRLLIDGRWVSAASGETIDTIDPATGQTIAAIARGAAADVEAAVAAARRAFEGPWAGWTPFERQRLLLRVQDIVDAQFDELALIETVDMGAPLARTRAMRTATAQVIGFYASQTRAGDTSTPAHSLPGEITAMYMKAPLGVVAGIIPWNAPLVSLWWIIGPVLATGCTAVIKPAEDASLSVLRVSELLLEAGVPAGVINVITGYGGEAGAALAAHPDVDRVSFTGSTETGRKIIAASAGNMKRVQLELGGKSPDIVFADADLDRAVPGTAMSVFANSGQVCIAGTRLLVQRSIHDAFVDRLSTFSRSLIVGDGRDPGVQLGPLVSKAQLDRVAGYVEAGTAEGARLVCGGDRPGGCSASGFFMAPTVFADVTNAMTIAREEIFGPVISVIPFDDPAEALRIANDTPYGLGGGVWTRDVSMTLRMARGLRAGTVWVNGYGAIDPAIGFGGVRMSGYGWKGGPEHVESFLYRKAVYITLD